MLRLARALAALAALPPVLAASGCFDTQEEFDKFLDRSAPFRSEPTAGECLGPVDLSGRYLMGVEVALDRSKPLRFVVTFDVDTAASPWSLTVSMQGLKTADGTPSGEVYTATAPVGDGGAFTLDFGSITVPPENDPILPTANVVANMQLSGCTSTATFACGLVTGDITAPVGAPLAGSTFALTPMPEGTDPASLTMASACPE